ncbi:hypothetical protein HZS_7277, partial [Henneguya salminicola]
RNESQAAPPQPTDRASIIIPDTYRFYEVTPGRIEEFILWDSGEQNEARILIFGRQSNSEWSHLIEKLYVDRTFSLAPNFFSQIYVIMPARGGFMLPVLYALLPNKEGRTYRRLFEAIKELWKNLNPSSIDFEQAAIGAFRTTFPNCSNHGCLFHLTKNMLRKLSDEGLLRRYNTDHDFALAARMIGALSFVPIEDIDGAKIATGLGVVHVSSPYAVYRTNNYVEAAHQRLQAEFGMDHPNIWKFIDGIRGFQKGRDLVYDQFVRGERPPVKRRKYVATDIRISTIVESYRDRNII